MISFEMAATSPEHCYRLLAAAVTPRPIAWVTTLAPDDRVNLSPFSCFTYLTYKPPLIAISIGTRDGTLKDTAANAEASGEFVVNAATPALVQKVADSSRPFPAHVSEAERLGIELASSHLRTPRVAASPLCLECELERVIEIEDDGRHRLLIGRVLWMEISPSIWSQDRIDNEKYRPLARLGGPFYADLGSILRVEPNKEA